MVNEHVIKQRKLDQNFPSTPLAIQNRPAAEFTSRYSGTESKYKCNSLLHCSECFTMAKISAIIVIKKVLLVALRKFSVLLIFSF